MKKGLGFLACAAILAVSAPASLATDVTISIEAEVITVDDPNNILAGQVTVGGIITGRYSYSTATEDSSELPTVGDYWHTSPPYGISLAAGELAFGTDPENVRLLVELVNDHGSPGVDNYLLRSYNNLPLPDRTPVTHIAWQLDDRSMSALRSTELTALPPILADWTSVFGVTIEGGDPYSARFMIRARVTRAEVVCCPVAAPPCTTETAQPSLSRPERLVRYVRDPLDDFEIDHPMFADLYRVLYGGDFPIPPPLDLAEVSVESDGVAHVFRLRTREGGAAELLRDSDRRVAFGVYIDTDGNGLSDVILTTTAGGRGSVVLTTRYEPIGAASELAIEGSTVMLTIPESLIGPTFQWMAFSGYSPIATAYYRTALEDVFAVPEIDVVASEEGASAILSFYSGPGSCQVMEKLAGAGCPSSCSGSGTVACTTVPGTSDQGKLYYRKQCGTRIYEFWCLDCCFGSRVYGGGTTGWVGRCPYACGMNFVDVWQQGPTVQLDKVYHTVRDGSCSGDTGSHHDGDGDSRVDSMHHTYVYATNLLTSCNEERDPVTNILIDKRCLPACAPYASLYSVPGQI